MSQVDHRSVRSLTTRFDTRAGVILITLADIRAASEPAARYGFMSTLLWDFVQLDITLVLVWVGIQLGLRPVKKLRDEIADALAARSASHRRIIGAARNRAGGRHAESLVRHAAHLRAVAAAIHRQYGASIAHADHRHAGPIGSLGRRTRGAADQGPLADAAGRAYGNWRTPPINCSPWRAPTPPPTWRPRIRPVDLSTIVGEVVAKFFDRALQSNIDLGVDVKPVSIHADPSLLDDLLSNLVDNALKYTPAGGSVTVSAGRAEPHGLISRWKTPAPASPRRSATGCGRDSIGCRIRRGTAADWGWRSSMRSRGCMRRPCPSERARAAAAPGSWCNLPNPASRDADARIGGNAHAIRPPDRRRARSAAGRRTAKRVTNRPDGAPPSASRKAGRLACAP